MQRVQQFINNFLAERGVVLSGEEMASVDFIGAGVIDSFETLNLFMSLDNEFGVRINPAQMVDKHLRTLDGLARFVAEHMNG